MKKLMRLSYVVVAVAAAVIAGCKSSKPTTGVTSTEKELNIYCSGPEYFTTKDFFRANAVGASSQIEIAKEKSLTIARGQLAASIETTVKSVTDNYLNSRSLNNKEEAESRFEQLNRQVVDQTLRGIKTLCEKQTQDTATGQFKYYVAIELSAADLVSKYNESLSKDDKLKIDYDYEKFKDTFNQEMEKRAKGN